MHFYRQKALMFMINCLYLRHINFVFINLNFWTMKKIMVSLVLVLVAISASAQTYVGGTFGFTSTDIKDQDKSLTQFTLAPEIGYNLDDSWAIGIGIGYSYAKQEISTNTISVSPYVRYTVAKFGICSFFVDGEITFASSKPEKMDALSGWSLGFKPGVRFDITKNIFATASLGFFGYQDSSDFDGTKTFGLLVSGKGTNYFSEINSGLKLGLYYEF